MSIWLIVGLCMGIAFGVSFITIRSYGNIRRRIKDPFRLGDNATAMLLSTTTPVFRGVITRIYRESGNTMITIRNDTGIEVEVSSTRVIVNDN